MENDEVDDDVTVINNKEATLFLTHVVNRKALETEDQEC